MDVEIKFEWDIKKAEINLSKHRVSFETAIRVFEDPNRCEVVDDYCHEENEYRLKTVGFVGSVLLLVIYVEREQLGTQIFRLISARKANEKERKWYGEFHPKLD